MKTIYKTGLIVGSILITAGVIAGIYLYNKQPINPEKAKTDYVITATDLLKEFENNEAAASAKFVNRIIELTGTIESLDTGNDSTLTVILKTDSDISSVICTFRQSQNRDELKPGAEITVKGECSGFLTDVLLNNCSLKK